MIVFIVESDQEKLEPYFSTLDNWLSSPVQFVSSTQTKYILLN